MNDIVQRLTAALSDRYTLQRELGAGGMATDPRFVDTPGWSHSVMRGRRCGVPAGDGGEPRVLRARDPQLGDDDETGGGRGQQVSGDLTTDKSSKPMPSLRLES